MKKFSFNTVLSLIKFKVSLAVTFTALTGYIVCTGHFDNQAIVLALGVFILAGGSSALNQFQESEYDAKMPRTMHRPIPTGEISSRNAFLISISFILAGLVLLFFGFGLLPALLGLFNIFWYNLVYTNLKKITPFAVVPGSLVGAVPVLIGWTAGGGYLFDPTIIFIAFFLFIWQVPHFWLLMLKYGKEYQKAGFPTINQSFNPKSLRNIIFSWIVSTSFISIIIPLLLVKLSIIFFGLIFVINIFFIGIFATLSFGKSSELNFKKSFMSINIYMMLFMILLIVFHLFPV